MVYGALLCGVWCMVLGCVVWVAGACLYGVFLGFVCMVYGAWLCGVWCLCDACA